jgi:hypothetical protein
LGRHANARPVGQVWVKPRDITPPGRPYQTDTSEQPQLAATLGAQGISNAVDFPLEKTMSPLFSLARSLSLSLFYFSNYQETSILSNYFCPLIFI